MVGLAKVKVSDLMQEKSFKVMPVLEQLDNRNKTVL